MQKTLAHYRDNAGIVFLSVQTVFEGFDANTADQVVPTMKKYELEDIPAGHDAGDKGSGSEMMHRYHSGGTPWIVIIDRKGVVRFNSFSLPPARAIPFIDSLLKRN